MKKIKAFAVALLLFILTITGIHFYISGKLNLNNRAYDYWTGEQKLASTQGIQANLNDKSIVVFGSSEFQHGTNSKYHPKYVFKGQDLNPMLIGGGYYQSLSHAITLGAIEPGMKNKKVVLVVSPSWFKKQGVDAKAFVSRFSEEAYINCMANPQVSEKVKAYIADRTQALLKDDPSALIRMQKYDAIRSGEGIDGGSRLFFKLYKIFLNEKSRFGTIMGAASQGIWRQKQDRESVSGEPIDWASYLEEAQQDGARLAEGNPYNMIDRVYRRQIAPIEKSKKDSALKRSYTKSAEYDDLRCFLDICNDLGIEVQLVSLPVNGIWYDHTGFPRSDREQYYENIRQIARTYHVRLADLSGHEYTKYFFEDSVHLALKGWVYLNESIYNFAEEA